MSTPGRTYPRSAVYTGRNRWHTPIHYGQTGIVHFDPLYPECLVFVPDGDPKKLCWVLPEYLYMP